MFIESIKSELPFIGEDNPLTSSHISIRSLSTFRQNNSQSYPSTQIYPEEIELPSRSISTCQSNNDAPTESKKWRLAKPKNNLIVNSSFN